jgi:hypothetical protein
MLKAFKNYGIPSKSKKKEDDYGIKKKNGVCEGDATGLRSMTRKISSKLRFSTIDRYRQQIANNVIPDYLMSLASHAKITKILASDMHKLCASQPRRFQWSNLSLAVTSPCVRLCRLRRQTEQPNLENSTPVMVLAQNWKRW